MTADGGIGGERRPLAITMGEPAGIGGEIVLKSWLRRAEGLPPFLVVDDADRLRRLAMALGLEVPVRALEAVDRAVAAFAGELPVWHRPLPRAVTPGRPEPDNAAAVIAAIEVAVDLVRRGTAAAVVTNPIHKKALYDQGFRFPGHTEFLGALAGQGARAVMMLVGGGLRVVPVTVHVSLRRAIESLSAAAIVAAAATAHAALVRDFGLPRPRLAVAGLNPHAGEEGTIGREDEDIVAPAVRTLLQEGIDAFGPVPPDTLFTPQARTGYDAAICMYHDQALIPLKALDFEGGVNVTLGLPFVRTSPDHGTALDIAGTGRASEGSLMAAIRLAAEMVARRSAAACR